MEAATAGHQQQSDDAEGHGVPGLPDDAPPAIVAASQGDREGAAMEGERSALDWLLGGTQALEHDVPVEYETPSGMVKLVFRIKQLDGAVLNAIDAQHRGEGPFGKLNTIEYNAHVASEATVYIADETGKKVGPKTEDFIGGHPEGAIGAMRTRFKYQPGILAGIEAEVRKLGAYSPDRVGAASRAIVAAAGNS